VQNIEEVFAIQAHRQYQIKEGVKHNYQLEVFAMQHISSIK